MKILKRPFYERDTALVAQELLGKIIVRVIDDKTILKGRIVETEAYMGIHDPASHAYGGKRIRNAPLFGPVGHAYVYFTYGMHFCLNFVSRAKGIPAGGVLIRAVEPLEGIEYMQHKRHMHKLEQLTNGPGKLTQAFSINRDFNGIDVTKKGPLFVIDAPAIHKQDIAASGRIGVSRAVEELLRFYIKDNRFVSRN
jgi:DNA-3-methyladenine glycosylase